MPDFIATLLFKKDPKHNPSDKKTGVCPVSTVCTDSTGAHHSILIHAEDCEEAKSIAVRVGKENFAPHIFVHITRVELVQLTYRR